MLTSPIRSPIRSAISSLFDRKSFAPSTTGPVLVDGFPILVDTFSITFA